MKKIHSLKFNRIMSVAITFMLVIICVLCAADTVSAEAADAYDQTYTDVRGMTWTYDIIDGTVHITNASKHSDNAFDGTVYIPEPGTFLSTAGMDVVVDSGAFGPWLEGMEEVHIPDKVELSPNSFLGCPDLKSVVPSSKINDNPDAFYLCDKLNLKAQTYYGSEGWVNKYGNPIELNDSYDFWASDYIPDTGKTIRYYRATCLYMLDSDYVVKFKIGEDEYCTSLDGCISLMDMTGCVHSSTWEIDWRRLGAQYKGSLKSITFEEGIEEVSSTVSLDSRYCYDPYTDTWFDGVNIDIYVPLSCTIFSPRFACAKYVFGTIRIHAVKGSAAEDYCKRMDDGSLFVFVEESVDTIKSLTAYDSGPTSIDYGGGAPSGPSSGSSSGGSSGNSSSGSSSSGGSTSNSSSGKGSSDKGSSGKGSSSSIADSDSSDKSSVPVYPFVIGGVGVAAAGVGGAVAIKFRRRK